MKTVKKILAAGIFAIAAAGCAGSAFAETFRMAVAWPENLTATRFIGSRFAEILNEKSGGAHSVILVTPDAIPPLEQFQPLQSGVVDLLFTHPAYHGGVSPVGLTMDAIEPNPEKWRAEGIFDLYAEHYASLGAQLLAIPPQGRKGFQIITRAPLSGETPSLDGLKIRGNISYVPLIEAMGGAPVNMSAGEIYTSLERGVLDGAAWVRTGVVDFKWNEVAKYYARPVFGQVSSMIYMNKARFDGLDQEIKALLVEVGKALELETFDTLEAEAVAQEQIMQEAGMTETRFNEADAAKLDALWSDGVWGIGMAKEPDIVGAIRDRAKAAGLSN